MPARALPLLVAALLLVITPPTLAETTMRAAGRPQPAPAAPSAAPVVTVPRVEPDARVESVIRIDGHLDEPAWRDAARLDGFYQYRPVDGRVAEERTEVLLWYSPTALHIGIVAHDRDPGSIRATVADRDKLDREDTVTVYLDTFLDRRRAFFFGVNPLGSQEDGVFSEGQFNAGTMMGGSTDRNPDYLFDSKGRLTAEGFVIEMRIPFKSLRYPASRAQRWGFNVIRKVQRTGYEDTWTDTRRAASFLAQAGVIEGLTDLERGIVTELQPFVTTSLSRERAGDGIVQDTSPEVGANLRLGFTTTSIDATINPDFSQVESDVGLVTVNERFALFYPEKRPFFLEGIELFATPNQLVYTRRIVEPFAGGKVTGKLGRLGLAYLGALDDTPGDNVWFNVARLRTDFGADSVAGVTLTDRTGGGASNRVLAADARYVFGRMYYLQGQVGGAWTERDEQSRSAPIWMGEFDRTGRSWGFNYKVTGIGEGFEAQAGFVPRQDIVEARAMNRLTWYGAPGAPVENATVFFGPSRIWRHGDTGGGAIEGSEWINGSVRARGGWSAGASMRRSFFVLEPADYARYVVPGPGGALQSYVAPDRLDDLWTWSAELASPTWQRFNAELEVAGGATAIFDEGAEGRQTTVAAVLGTRPTASLRADLSVTFAELRRARDESEFARTLLPRVRVEYQPTRALSFRFVSEYRAERVAALRDARSGAPLFVDAAPLASSRANVLQIDALVSYRPSPGTIAYIGYGSILDEPSHLPGQRRNGLDRARDAFFAKVAYLFRR